jgi:hypothetical protein
VKKVRVTQHKWREIGNEKKIIAAIAGTFLGLVAVGVVIFYCECHKLRKKTAKGGISPCIEYYGQGKTLRSYLQQEIPAEDKPDKTYTSF